MINYNPQVLTDAFSVSTTTTSLMGGAVEQILENNPNRVAVIFQAYEAPVIINIRRPSSSYDGFSLYTGLSPFVLEYRNHGAMVGYEWFAYNAGGFATAHVSVIESSYRPRK